MKRIAFQLALFVSAVAVFCIAQGSGAMPPGHMMLSSPDAFAEGHLAALDKQVGLTAEQKPKVRAVFMEEANALFAVFGDKNMTQEQKHARIQQIHVTSRNQVWNLPRRSCLVRAGARFHWAPRADRISSHVADSVGRWQGGQDRQAGLCASRPRSPGSQPWRTASCR